MFKTFSFYFKLLVDPRIHLVHLYDYYFALVKLLLMMVRSSNQMVIVSITNSRKQTLGVAGIDFSLTHLYYHLTEAYHQCGTTEYRSVYHLYYHITEAYHQCGTTEYRSVYHLYYHITEAYHQCGTTEYRSVYHLYYHIIEAYHQCGTTEYRSVYHLYYHTSERYSGIFQIHWLLNHLDVHLVWTTSETSEN